MVDTTSVSPSPFRRLLEFQAIALRVVRPQAEKIRLDLMVAQNLLHKLGMTDCTLKVTRLLTRFSMVPTLERPNQTSQ